MNTATVSVFVGWDALFGCTLSKGSRFCDQRRQRRSGQLVAVYDAVQQGDLARARIFGRPCSR
jgi:hypothetical protein